MKRLGRTLETAAWATFFACAAIVPVLRYGVLPQVERLRPEIVARVSAIVGQPVRIGAIDAQWLGLRPQINLTDVRIYDAAGREALVLPSVENILSWRSLLHGRLRLHALRVDGPRLAVRRDAQGELYIAGIKLVPTPGEPGFSDWVFGQDDIQVSNAEIEWRDDKRAAPPLVLSSINLRVTNSGERHRLGADARLPEALGTQLQLRAEVLARDVDELRAWNGKAYAELGNTDLAAWRAWLDYPVDVERGQGALRLWVTIAGGAVEQASADVALGGVRATLGEGLPALDLASVSARVQATRAADGYRFAARHVVFAPQTRAPLAPLDFDLAWNAAGGVASASALELAPLAHLGETLPLPAELRRATLELEPRGKLENLRFEWQGAVNAPTGYKASARFSDLALKAHEALPGVARLAGSIEATAAGGHLTIDARGAELELPRVFAEPRLAFDILSGELAWQRQDAGFKIDVSSLTFTNADLSGNGFGSYTYDGDGPGKVDLSAVLSRADAKHLAHYLPLGALMGEKPRAWLVRGILAGEASEVQFRLQGDLRRFPFVDPAQGRFLVTARVHKGVLDYADNWPRIDDIEAQLSFERNRMDITGRSGAILGTKLHDVHVSIPDLGSRAPRVLVNGQAEGMTARFLQFIDASPLRTSAGRFTQAMTARGDGRLRLQLELPLAKLAASKVSGEYELLDNDIALARGLPPIQAARGKVAFTESSLALHEVRGRIFGGAVAITGSTRANGSMDFVARGEARAAELGTLIADPLRRYLSGAAHYAVSVSLRGELQRVAVDSSLRGIASTLPPPFDKSAGAAAPLHVEYSPLQGGAQRFTVSLARLAAAEVRRVPAGDAMRVERAALWLSPSGQAVRLPEQPAILVYGTLAALDVDRWRALYTPSAGGAALPLLLELKLGRLDAYGKRIQNVAVRARTEDAGWSAVVDADEVAGRLRYERSGTGRLVARLVHLTVPAATPGFTPRPARAGDFPALDVVADAFNLRGKDLGRLELAAVPDGADWRIDKLGLASDDATLNARGRWRDGEATDLDFSLSAADAGRFLARIGYPKAVLGGKAELAGSLSWTGEPTSMDYASLSGEIKLTAEDGQFLEIDPGFGKLISLMNLQALPRRITLDFRDVFSKGFRFDRIDAASHVKQGTMEIGAFHMKGPAADVAMSGSVDLAHETQNLRVRVVPSIGGSASTLVTIVNPVAGVASALAQKVLKDPLGQLFAREYDVSGGWSDPKVVNVTVVPALPPNETATQ
jgi:uncharacterized protein (TIGR02099 family)